MSRLFHSMFSITRTILLICASLAQSVNAQKSDSRSVLWSVDWSSDGKYFAVGGAWAGIFNVEGERTQAPALDSLKAVAKVRWHPRRNLLALSSGGEGGMTGVYDPAADQTITLETKEGTRGISWNSSGERLATAGNRGELQIWSANGRLLHTTRPANAKSLTGVAWHPTEDRIVTIGEFITLYDGNGSITKKVSHRPGAKGYCLLLCVEWHPSGEFFVVGDYGNSDAGEAPILQFWSSDCKLLKKIEVTDGAAFRNVSWNRDGSLLASASDALRIWSREGQLRHIGKSPDLLWGVRWNRDGSGVLTSSHDGRVSLWSAEAQLSRHLIDVSATKSEAAQQSTRTPTPRRGR